MGLGTRNQGLYLHQGAGKDVKGSVEFDQGVVGSKSFEFIGSGDEFESSFLADFFSNKLGESLFSLSKVKIFFTS